VPAKFLTIIVLLLGISSAGATSRPPGIRNGERDHFTLHAESDRYLNLIDSVITSTRRKLIGMLGDSLSYKPDIYLVDNVTLFDRLAGGKFPDWGAAVAVPHRRLIAIKSPNAFNLNRSLPELLAHEYAHLVVAQKTGFHEAPRWFDEGLAMFVSMEWSWSDNLAMSKAAVFGQFIDLGEIEMVNRFSAGKAHVAYAQSYLMVEYLFDNYGPEPIRRFLEGIAAGMSHDQALELATGSNLAEFESDIKIYLHNHFNVLTLFMDTIYFWLALAVIVIIAGISRIRKRRRYYEKWDQEEKFHSTDFDYGDPDNPEKIDDEDEPWRS